MLDALGFNLADILVVAFLLLFAIIGFRKGLITMISSLVSTVAALIAAFLLSRPLAAYLASAGGLFTKVRESIRDFFLDRADDVGQSIGTTITDMKIPKFMREPLEENLNLTETLGDGAEALAQTVFQYLLTAVAAILIFIGVLLLFRLLAGVLNTFFERFAVLKAANRSMGLLAGIANGVILLLILMAVIGLLSPLIPGISASLSNSLIARYFYDFNSFLSVFSRLTAWISGPEKAV